MQPLTRQEELKIYPVRKKRIRLTSTERHTNCSNSGQWNNRVISRILYTKFIQTRQNKEEAIMKEGLKVKVIKKGAIKPQIIKEASKSKRGSAREIVSNVTNWVNDLQARKRDETKVAIEKFFNQQPQPSEL